MTDPMTKLKNLTKRLKITPSRPASTKSSVTSPFLIPAPVYFSSPSPTSKGKPHLDDVFMTSPKRRLSSTRSVPLSPMTRNDERDSKHIGDMQIKLDEITAEILAMKRADEDLARKLLTIYSEIHAFKVSDSYVKNGELLDEAIHEAEVANFGPQISDEPRKALNKVLQRRGVTRMNLWTRRFSCA